ncbi:hypothetical protein LshimejAT787_0901300 [Lyophyllum shimeji]|uniref:Uncharacterized protein n=1 Tax=Lyophyllum shimeji TaxID=47721 RepID=A0A9P3UR47_LYOSH|nr:hypothetical protein LshimejAT787_0901300 [Lyophyllum shimeji]
MLDNQGRARQASPTEKSPETSRPGYYAHGLPASELRLIPHTTRTRVVLGEPRELGDHGMRDVIRGWGKAGEF